MVSIKTKTFSWAFITLLGLLSVANIAYAKVETITTCTSATFNGSVPSASTKNPVTVWFEWGTPDIDGYNYPDATESQVLTSKGDFSDIVFGLTPDTNYYYKAIASNKDSRVSGKMIRFKTPRCGAEPQSSSSAPIAVTVAATNISSTSAELNSTIMSPEGLPSITWFEWGTNENLSNKTKIMRVGSFSSIPYKDTISGLTPGTTYYYRAVAENSKWRNIGVTLSFVANTNTLSNIQSPSTVNKKIPSDNITTKTAVEDTEKLTANALDAGSFLPATLLGWVFFLVLLLILIALGKHIYRELEGKKHL